MDRLLCIETAQQLADLAELSRQSEGLPLLDPQILTQQAPDAHWVLIRDRSIAGYCSLWWQNTPLDRHHQLGLIGHYGVQDAEAASQLLHYVCQQLAAQGCTLAIAPIDGNTWRRYRLISQRGTEALFFLEPDNPDQWCDHFYSAGFSSIAQYSSALALDLTQQDPRLNQAAARLANVGIEIRSIDLEQFEQELQAIHTLSLTSFRQNLFYTPIDRAEFVAQYRQIKPYVQPQLVLMAEQAGTLVGFLFAIPDLLQAQRGESINTVIIKTVAVLPGRAYAGLGNLLVARVQAIAHQLGYTRAIHALMHDANNSRNLSSRYAAPIRRYTLFGKPLLSRTEIPSKIPN